MTVMKLRQTLPLVALTSLLAACAMPPKTESAPTVPDDTVRLTFDGESGDECSWRLIARYRSDLPEHQFELDRFYRNTETGRPAGFGGGTGYLPRPDSDKSRVIGDEIETVLHSMTKSVPCENLEAEITVSCTAGDCPNYEVGEYDLPIAMVLARK